MGKVKVKQVWNKTPGSLGPIQVKFQHAEISTNAVGKDLSKYFSGHIFKPSRNVSTYLDGGSSKNLTNKRAVVLANDLMTYVGYTNNSTGQSTDTMKTYIAVRKNNRMELFETTPVTVSPLVTSSFVEEKEKDSAVKQSPEERRNNEAALIKAFGSKKKRITFENREKNEVTNMNESIQAAAEDIKVTRMPPEIKDTSYLYLIPPCNRDAVDVKDVYKISDVITDEELELLETFALQCLNSSAVDVKAWQDSNMFSDYFYASLKWLKVRKEEARNVLSMKLVLYTEILIRFFNFDFYCKKRFSCPPEFPEELVRKVYNEFTFQNAVGIRSFPNDLKDKCCCYIMVLVLLAGDFLFDVQLMSTIFKIHIKKLLVLARAVGITVSYGMATKEYKALLKLPLPTIIERRGRRKRT